MRLTGLLVLCLMLAACTNAPFPPAVMKEFGPNTFDVRAWMDQAYHPAHKDFTSRKVKLAGVILEAIRNPDGVVLLVKQEQLKEDIKTSPTSVEQDSPRWFALVFHGAVEPRVLQTGNHLIAVGMTDSASAESFGGAPRVLPHLQAQCLHVWNDLGVQNMYLCNGDTSYAGLYPPDEQTFCLERNTADGMSSGSDSKEAGVSGGETGELRTNGN